MLAVQLPYVPNLCAYRRRRTRVVMVGDVGVGGDHPIRVQSMTTTLTKDISATVAQVERLVAVGCEIVRITTPTPSDARCLGPIKEQLAAKGIQVPIVADIHFSPAAALAAAEFADKVRINPGNYTDSRKFAVREYTQEQYQTEIDRLERDFTPLVLKCKERGVAMRIGTNHGSLSDRIMNRFGDTPEGMVESALEFVRICESHDYREIILSMKASNPKVMIAAYRLLAARMAREGMDYPFHLGVTEAGNAEDGRIKSAVGIGSLLEDGIGDTIRVSLTEEPEAEVPVAFAIAGRYHDWPVAEEGAELAEAPWDFYHFERRASHEERIGDGPIGGTSPAAVIVPIEGPLSEQPTAMARLLRWASPAGRRQPKAEVALVHLTGPDDLAALKKVAERLQKWPQARLALIARADDSTLLLDALPHVDGAAWTVSDGIGVHLMASAARDAGKFMLVEAAPHAMGGSTETIDLLLRSVKVAAAEGAQVAMSLRLPDRDAIHGYRLLMARAREQGIDAPIVLQVHTPADPLLPASIVLGSLLCDGIGDAVSIGGMEDSTILAFNILQATGTRLFKTDYVACPSCGRTLFDLQETTERIKQRTTHLVGVRLAIMGCIVNGPGEMADADFGYVGGAPGQVNLYVGKECVERGVPAAVADDRLVELIKAHGRWQEPEEDTE